MQLNYLNSQLPHKRTCLSSWIFQTERFLSFFQGFVHEQNQQFANPSVSWFDIVAIAADEFQQDQMHSQGHFSWPAICQPAVSLLLFSLEHHDDNPIFAAHRSLYDNKIHTLENGTFRGLDSLQTL